MSENELERYFCVIDRVTDAGMVHLTLIDSKNINIKYTAISTVEVLEDRGLRIHEEKNFHFVINKDGEWNVFWIRNQFLTIEEENLKNKAFNEFLKLYYKQK